MKNPKERSTAILVGVAAGAILMALMFMIVFGLHTGIAGVVLVLLIVAVSAISGWLIGWNQRIQRSNYYSYDLMFYINNSDVNKIFEGTPETIVPGICTELGIESGTMAATGVNISSMPCFGKKAYEAIMMAYTAAAKQNGSKYIPLMTNINKVSVLEKGTLCGAVMTGDYNLIEATYKSTLQKLVNRVLITDKNNNVIKTVEDAASIQKYGLVQRVLKQNDGEDATTQAKKMLVTVESSATVSGVPNDFRAVSGYSIIVQETDTGLYGQFYIESDTHTFSCGKAQMDLTLAFENLMDERGIEETT